MTDTQTYTCPCWASGSAARLSWPLSGLKKQCVVYMWDPGVKAMLRTCPERAQLSRVIWLAVSGPINPDLNTSGCDMRRGQEVTTCVCVCLWGPGWPGYVGSSFFSFPSWRCSDEPKIRIERNISWMKKWIWWFLLNGCSQLMYNT